MTAAGDTLHDEMIRARSACERAVDLQLRVAAALDAAAAGQADLTMRRRIARRMRREVRRERAAMREALRINELHERYARRHDPDDRAALVAHYRPNAIALARRFADRGEPFEDLVQVAQTALVAALDRFDPTLGVPFVAFLRASVSGELKRYFRDKVWPLRVPRSLLERYLECRAANERLSHELGRPATVAQVAEALGMTEEAVLEAMEVGNSYRVRSLDAPVRGHDGDRATGVDIADPSAQVAYAAIEQDLVRVQLLFPLLESLDDDDARLVRGYYLEGRRQQDLADELGVTQVTVSRRLARAIAQLRRLAAGRA